MPASSATASTGAPTIAAHVWRLFGASALLILLLVSVLWWDIYRIDEMRAAGRSAAAVERDIQHLGEGLLNAETGQRGYLLTADEHYLEPYGYGVEDARKSIAALEAAPLEDEVREAMPRLKSLADEQLAELDAGIALVRAGHRDAALHRLATGRGKVLMDQIRVLRARMLVMEINLRDARRNQIDAKVLYTTLTALLGGAAAVALLFLYARKATRRLGSPVRDLINRIHAFTVESGQAQVEQPALDEIGWISREFNETVKRLKAAGEERDHALGELRDALESLRRSQTELRDRESRLSTVVENIPAMISYIDRDERYRFVNANYCDWTGLHSAGVLGRTVREVHGAEAHRGILPLVADLLAGHQRRLEQKLERDGAERWVSSTMVPQFDAQGEVAGFYGFSYDVTERRLAELALLESRRKLQLIIDNIPGLVSNVDRELRFRFVNRGYADWFQVDTTALIGMPLREFYGEAAFAGIAGVLQAALSGQTVVSEREVTRGGAPRYCNVVVVPERDAAGAVVGLFVIHTDITPHKRLERDLAIARDHYQSLYQATPTMLHSADLQGRLVSVSDTWLAKLGYERADVIGQPASAYLAPDSRLRSRDIVLPQLFQTGRCENVHVQLQRSDGSLLDVLLSAVVQRDTSGHAVRTLSVMEDISGTLASNAALKKEHGLRLEIEQRAAELDALLAERNEMLYVLAHEVRQPLNNASAVLQNAGLLLAEKGQAVEAARIQKAQGLMGVILADIDNTLAVASLVAIDGPPEVIDTDIDTLVRIAIGDMAAAERPRVQVLRQTETRTASMDPGLMRLALRNLLANALRYSPLGSPVTVSIADSDEPLALVLEVSDEGDGIAPALLPRLFERGNQGERSRHEPGHGLGLYIVRRIMEIHGGRVDLVSSGPRGTVMRTVIPQSTVY
jgi:PAS domain S-box-containing protein